MKAAALNEFSSENMFLSNHEINQYLNKLAYIGLTDFCLSSKSIDGVDVEFVGSLPESMVEELKKISQKDLIANYILNSSQPVFESRIIEYLMASPYHSPVVDAAMIRHQINRSHGYFDSYSISPKAKDYPYSVSFYATGMQSDEFKKVMAENTEELKTISEMLYDIILNIMSRTAAESLSQRQVEILKNVVVSSGGLKVVASQMGISVRTVQKHIDDIKKTLGATSLNNAIYLAMKRGFLD